MEALERLGARLVARVEPEYPPLLAHIEDAPPLIGVRGHLHLLSKRAVAVVGARNASINGQRIARTLSTDLGRDGLLVVSGMARGIDAAAHEGALETGTVAVLAGGVDVIYPKGNAGLYERIVERGAIVSEMPPGTQPTARHFPTRNRLISGFGYGVVVVEASLRSGSLITARTALDQGREVFACPGSALDPRARGTNRLIREGATLTEAADDVLCVLSPLFEGALEDAGLGPPAGPPPAPPSAAELVRARHQIEGSLAPTPVTVDEIIRCCQLCPAVVSTVLLELDLAGRLERHPGNRVSLLAEP